MQSGPSNGVAGKQVVLTGGTNGIGLAAAEALAAGGAHVALVARDKGRGEAAAARARARSSGGVVDVVAADLSSQADVRRLAAEIASRYDRVDILVNNAGAIFASRQLTGDGIEQTWAVNHLAPFLLTTLLLEKLRLSAPARVITTASDAAKNAQVPFDDLDGRAAYGRGMSSGRGFRRYGQTKLANIVFTAELARRLEGSGVTAYSFHPGTVATNFNHNNGPVMSLAMAVIKPFHVPPPRGPRRWCGWPKRPTPPWKAVATTSTRRKSPCRRAPAWTASGPPVGAEREASGGYGRLEPQLNWATGTTPV